MSKLCKKWIDWKYYIFIDARWLGQNIGLVVIMHHWYWRAARNCVSTSLDNISKYEFDWRRLLCFRCVNGRGWWCLRMDFLMVFGSSLCKLRQTFCCERFNAFIMLENIFSSIRILHLSNLTNLAAGWKLAFFDFSDKNSFCISRISCSVSVGLGLLIIFELNWIPDFVKKTISDLFTVSNAIHSTALRLCAHADFKCQRKLMSLEYELTHELVRSQVKAFSSVHVNTTLNGPIAQRNHRFIFYCHVHCVNYGNFDLGPFYHFLQFHYWLLVREIRRNSCSESGRSILIYRMALSLTANVL